jgi:hypothetical protein
MLVHKCSTKLLTFLFSNIEVKLEEQDLWKMQITSLIMWETKFLNNKT